MVKRKRFSSKATSNDLRIKDIGGRKARVGITVSEALTSLVPAMFSLAIMEVATQILADSLSKSGLLDSQSGLNRKENQK
jgi:hypothetical protein